MSLTEFLRAKLKALPEAPGVYLFKDRLGTILYVGKAKNLRSRVRSYFLKGKSSGDNRIKIASMLPLVQDLEVIELRSEMEALLLEGKYIKEFRPKYNTAFLDDKRFPWIRVDVQNPFAKFRLVREPLPDKSRYFGPFLMDRAVFTTLKALRKRFGILLADAAVKQLEDERYALYSDARAEIYGFPSVVTPEEYTQRVAQACAFLEGETTCWIAECEEKMEAAAQRQQYEKAAQYRDLLQALTHTGKLRTRKFKNDRVRSPVGEASVQALQEALGVNERLSIIECFDISHISGTFTVASMVRFTDGRADKRHYRRFKIQSFEGNDDYRAMNEVVHRRYRRLIEEHQPLPDLIVIDGGLGQVRAAQIAFADLKIEPPPLIGLAKREESIIFPDERPALKLALHHPGLQLLQRLRDEAHRFANSFSAQLRRKKLGESLLDEIPGLGSSRKQLLLEKFGSLKGIQSAKQEDLATLSGIGPKLAAVIWSHLHQSI